MELHLRAFHEFLFIVKLFIASKPQRPVIWLKVFFFNSEFTFQKNGLSKIDRTEITTRLKLFMRSEEEFRVENYESNTAKKRLWQREILFLLEIFVVDRIIRSAMSNESVFQLHARYGGHNLMEIYEDYRDH